MSCGLQKGEPSCWRDPNGLATGMMIAENSGKNKAVSVALGITVMFVEDCKEAAFRLTKEFSKG